jgi:hypothetical protein
MSTLKVTTIRDLSNGTAVDVPNAAKAWVNFNGTGTIAIRASYNVTSLTDNGTGDYTINFTNALTDANYALAGMGTNEASAQVVLRASGTAASTTSVRINTQLPNVGAGDSSIVCVVIFR